MRPPQDDEILRMHAQIEALQRLVGELCEKVRQLEKELRIGEYAP